MKGEHLNMDRFSILALLKKKKKKKNSSMETKEPSQLLNWKFCFIIRNFKKIKFWHNNLELF